MRKYDTAGRTMIIAYLKNCKKVVDLGCAGAKIRPDAIGIDCDEKWNPDVVADFFNYDINADGICMSHALEHVIDTRKLLKILHTKLDRGGRIAIAVPDGEAVPSSTLGDSAGTHEMLFTPITLKKYLENAGFQNVVSVYYNRPYAYQQTKGIFAGGEK